jgi:hypothetical protein
MPGVISAVKGLTERARSSAVPLIYIQGVRTLNEPEFTVFGENYAEEAVQKISAQVFSKRSFFEVVPPF